MTDIGGLLWLFIDVVLVLALAGALAYGVYMWRTWRPSAATRQARDAATKRNYGAKP